MGPGGPAIDGALAVRADGRLAPRAGVPVGRAGTGRAAALRRGWRPSAGCWKRPRGWGQRSCSRRATSSTGRGRPLGSSARSSNGSAHPWVPVHMIPGNHDPCGVGSVYDARRFKARPANLHFHDRPGPVVLAEHEATLYPCPCSARFGPDPMEWIPPRGANDGWRIGLAHGSLPFCADAENRNYPIRADAPRRFDLDYVALGDWHKPTPDPRENPRARDVLRRARPRSADGTSRAPATPSKSSWSRTPSRA